MQPVSKLGAYMFDIEISAYVYKHHDHPLVEPRYVASQRDVYTTYYLAFTWYPLSRSIVATSVSLLNAAH